MLHSGCLSCLLNARFSGYVCNGSLFVMYRPMNFCVGGLSHISQGAVTNVYRARNGVDVMSSLIHVVTSFSMYVVSCMYFFFGF